MHTSVVLLSKKEPTTVLRGIVKGNNFSQLTLLTESNLEPYDLIAGD